MRVRFEREISALQTMSHRNIVTFEGENLPEGTERFYVMPVYSNTLRRYVATGRNRDDWRFFADLAVTLADAMQYAHGLGFIHRDLKPENILFNGGGPLVIADWGLGYFVHRNSIVLQHLTRGGMGTEYYCSLEQWNTGKCDGRGDIYALGMLLDECINGVQRSITVGMGVNGPVTKEDSLAARKFNALVRQMTQPFAASRPSSMREVVEQLRYALAF
jgi:serine/threonine protein kinase